MYYLESVSKKSGLCAPEDLIDVSTCLRTSILHLKKQLALTYFLLQHKLQNLQNMMQPSKNRFAEKRNEAQGAELIYNGSCFYLFFKAVVHHKIKVLKFQQVKEFLGKHNLICKNGKINQ